MSAVVESIAELGFKRSTASEIARRSGLTWGAVQHHFGGKDGILAAVLEDSFNRFAERLADIASEGVPLAERVELFVDRAWEHFASAHFRSTFEILQHYGASSREHGWQDQMLAGVERHVDPALRRRAALAAAPDRAPALHGVGARGAGVAAALRVAVADGARHGARPLEGHPRPRARVVSPRLADYAGAFEPDFGFDRLEHAALARLGRELMLFAHFHDRGLMPLVAARFGRDWMTPIACDEWMGASPVYNARARALLGIEGDGVSAILKALQVDPGFAHRYMDVRYQLVDERLGYFWLPFCGAYQDVTEDLARRGARADPALPPHGGSRPSTRPRWR